MDRHSLLQSKCVKSATSLKTLVGKERKAIVMNFLINLILRSSEEGRRLAHMNCVELRELC